jgi:hypothetical protein
MDGSIIAVGCPKAKPLVEVMVDLRNKLGPGGVALYFSVLSYTAMGISSYQLSNAKLQGRANLAEA